MALVFDKEAIARAIREVAQHIAEKHRNTEAFALVGIANGGVIFGRRVARELTQILGREVPCGTINAQFHRDDIAHKPIPKAFMRSDIPFDIDGMTVILMDDVLFTGRTVRAAMSELFDHGRPKKVELAAFCDRGGRSLPIEANYTGLVVDASPDQEVVVKLSTEPSDEEAVTVVEEQA